MIGKLVKRKSLKTDRRKSVTGQISEGTDIPNEIARALKESEEDTDELPASELDGGHSDAMDSGADGAQGSDDTLQEEALPAEKSEGLDDSQQSIVVEAGEPESIGNPQVITENPSADNEYGDAIPTTPKTPADIRSTADVSFETDSAVVHGAEDRMMALSSELDFAMTGSQSTWHNTSAAEPQKYMALETESLDRQGFGNIDQSPSKDAFSATSVREIDDQASDLNLAASTGQCEVIEPQMSGTLKSGSPTRDEAIIDKSAGEEILAAPTSESPFLRHPTVEAAQPEAESPTVGPDINPSAAETSRLTEPPKLPQSRTRSGTRFSDDTTLLKDFLNRARAHKAAKATPNPSELSNPLDTAEPIPFPRRSPRRSPRKALLELDRNSPSPTKSRDMTLRPSTPPEKASKHVGFNDAGNHDDEDGADCHDDTDAATTEPTSRRRSTRTRLPTPAAHKPQTGAPSFIPLIRRGTEGVEPLVLKKSEAQDLAAATRANTRRNKGAAKRPALTLQTLTANTTPDVKDQAQKGARGKTVQWAEQLVHFQDEPPTSDDSMAPKDGAVNTPTADAQPDSRPAPKLRRLKLPGLPTPAPKQQLDIESAALKTKKSASRSAIPKGTPAAKKRVGLGLGLGVGVGGEAGAMAGSGSGLGLRRKGKGR